MNQVITREMRRQLERDNAKLPLQFASVPPKQWPKVDYRNPPCAVWRNRFFLVQEFNEVSALGPVKRLTVARTVMQSNGRWEDGITWNDLQEIKSEIGFGDHYAIEIFPRDRDVVNVANMRHLWFLSSPLDIGWFK